jgi:hypothetical protein
MDERTEDSSKPLIQIAPDYSCDSLINIGFKRISVVLDHFFDLFDLRDLVLRDYNPIWKTFLSQDFLHDNTFLDSGFCNHWFTPVWCRSVVEHPTCVGGDLLDGHHGILALFEFETTVPLTSIRSIGKKHFFFSNNSGSRYSLIFQGV